MLRRLYHTQPESFSFTPANHAWAEGQISKYPEGRQASAVIPLLWRAQEQEGWLSRPAIEHVAEMLDMAHIRALEVATFYFMFQLQPVGSFAHIQVCGTTSCMICGAEDLIAVCKAKIAEKPHEISESGKLSWEEVECLGACANAPMAQIGKDYYEDLTAKRFAEIIDELNEGSVPSPGPQNGRFASEPASGLTSLSEYEETGRTNQNASVGLATDLSDTVKRIDGTEVPLLTPWLATSSGTRQDASNTSANAKKTPAKNASEAAKASPGKTRKVSATSRTAADNAAKASKPGASPAAAKPSDASPEGKTVADKGKQTEPTVADVAKFKPVGLAQARGGKPDDLKLVKGIGPKLEQLLNENGIFHFDQIGGWSEAEIYWADYGLAKFKGRATRDEWVEQAKILASGAETEFSKRTQS